MGHAVPCARWCAWLAILWLVGAFAKIASAQTVPTKPEPTVLIEPRPSWVVVSTERAASPPEAPGGVATLHLERQLRVEGGTLARYIAGEELLVAESGAAWLGERKFEWDPSYEQLVLHSLAIRRDGQLISHLAQDRIQVLRREAGMQNSVYDGTRTALVIVPDVRVGDVLSYEYSIVGQNPVLDGHVSESIVQAAPFAVGSSFARVVTDHPFRVKAHFGAVSPSPRVESGLTTYEWSGRDLPAKRQEDFTPPGEHGLPWVELADFDSWRDVARWGAKLFRAPSTVSPAVSQWAAEISSKTTSKPERVLSALRRVQKDIRYLSLAFAESSHRPAPPGDVVERRFGDCKDKSFLMVALLRELGIPAEPTLVSTWAGRTLKQRLPSIRPFDHVIVHVALDGREYWLDPTRLHQRGNLDEVSIDDFDFVLVLDDSTTELTGITPVARGGPDVETKATYVVSDWGKPIKLVVDAIYRHHAADATRALRADQSPSDFARAMSEQVTRTHGFATLGETKVDDREDDNTITVHQTFDLAASTWQVEGDRQLLEVFTPPLTRYIAPITPDRSAAIQLYHPLRAIHDVTLDLPEAIEVAGSGATLDNDFWRFQWSERAAGKKVLLHYEIVSKSTIVEPKGLAAYRDAVTALTRETGYRIWTGGSPLGALPPTLGEPSFRLSTAVSILIAWVMATMALLAWLQRKQPWLPRRDIPYDAALVGRTGWLAVMGFGVTISPVLAIVRFVRGYTDPYEPSVWYAMTTPGSPDFISAWAPVFLAETCVTITLIVGSLWVAYLYWSRSRTFPIAYVAVTMLAIVFFVADGTLAASALGQKQALPIPTTTLVFSFAWAGYALFSRRVRATFLPVDPLPASLDEEVVERKPRRRRRKVRAADAPTAEAEATKPDEPTD